jgi:hypothetical protein
VLGPFIGTITSVKIWSMPVEPSAVQVIAKLGALRVILTNGLRFIQKGKEFGPINSQGTQQDLFLESDDLVSVAGGLLLLGPVLHLAQVMRKVTFFYDLQRWFVTALFVTEDVDRLPSLVYEGRRASASRVLRLDQYTVWLYEMPIKLGAADRQVEYTAPTGQRFRFLVPALNRTPSFLFGSALAPASSRRNPTDKLLALPHIASELRTGTHLLVLAGGQVSLDALFNCSPTCRDFFRLPEAEQAEYQWNARLEADVRHFFLQTYVQQWREPALAQTLASVVSVMALGTLDLWPARLPPSPAALSIRQIAKELYFALQHGGTDSLIIPLTAQDGLNSTPLHAGLLFPRTALLVLDLETDVDSRRLLSDESWALLRTWTSTLPSDTYFTFVVLTVPVVPTVTDSALLDICLPHQRRRRVMDSLISLNSADYEKLSRALSQPQPPEPPRRRALAGSFSILPQAPQLAQCCRPSWPGRR